MTHDENAYYPIPEGAIVLDFSGCRYYDDLHDVVKKAFGFPDYYGYNLDALWDCLDYLFQDKREVKIYGYHGIPSDLKEHLEGILKVFHDVHQNTPNVTFRVVS